MKRTPLRLQVLLLVVALLLVAVVAMQGGWLALVALVLFTVWREIADRVWFSWYLARQADRAVQSLSEEQS